MAAEKKQRRYFRLTSEGRALWARRESLPLPADYRRILGMVEFAGYPEVIRSHLARYPGAVVDEWLTEFEALRLIESIAAEDVSLDDLARKSAPPPVDVDDLLTPESEVSFVDISLSRLGVYVSYERIANRPANRKPPRSTVALVVEDDPDQQALAVLRLTAAEYAVRTAENVKALYASLREEMPDAVFLDIGLPDGDGFEVLAKLRRHPEYTHLPVIMLTARTEPGDVARGLALGADGYITKPYGRNTLEYALRYVMKQVMPDPRYPAPAAARAVASKPR